MGVEKKSVFGPFEGIVKKAVKVAASPSPLDPKETVFDTAIQLTHIAKRRAEKLGRKLADESRKQRREAEQANKGHTPNIVCDAVEVGLDVLYKTAGQITSGVAAVGGKTLFTRNHVDMPTRGAIGAAVLLEAVELLPPLMPAAGAVLLFDAARNKLEKTFPDHQTQSSGQMNGKAV